MNPEYHIDVTQEAGKRFFMQQHEGPIVMLNLLRFKEIADYSEFPDLAPAGPISGEDAYQLYMQHTTPFLKEAGSELIFQGKGAEWLIGPEGNQWDLVLLVRHASVPRFMKFASEEGYLKIAGHRTAALLDSRLLPITEV